MYSIKPCLTCRRITRFRSFAPDLSAHTRGRFNKPRCSEMIDGQPVILQRCTRTPILMVLILAALPACRPTNTAVLPSPSASSVALTGRTPTEGTRASPTIEGSYPSARATPSASRVATTMAAPSARPSPRGATIASASPMDTFQQTTITEQDSGKTLVYPETARFQIELDPQTSPRSSG